MLLRLLRTGLLLSVLFLSNLAFAQNKTPRTLLWRITGKGVQEPSYLFGTMHLPDKRLFQFGDSLYAALQRTRGYAMEINADEFVDSLFQNSLQQAEEKLLLKKQKVKLNRRRLSREADSLLKSVGVQGDVATKGDLKKLRDRRMQNVLQRGEMPTFMDAFLLGLARRLNKWTGGIEDVSDQLSLSDELGGELEPEAVLQPEADFRTGIEALTKVYLSQDLDEIDRISNTSYKGADRDAMLIHRNVKMASRMDSLSHERSMFFAVGAAHLPGDSGVITLLQKRGYDVVPVFSSTTRFAGDFAATLPEAAWTKVDGDENAYSVRMPGQPSDYNVMGNLLKMKMYFDLTTLTFYLSGSVTGPNADASKLDGMLEEAVKGMTGKKLKGKLREVQSAGLIGKEVFAENDEANYRLRVLLQNKTVFLLMVGAVKKGAIHGPDVERFITSFAPGEPVVQSSAWVPFSLPEKGVAVQFPAKPARNEAVDKSVQSQGPWHSVTYNAADSKNGFFYMLQMRDVNEGMMIQNDSAYFDQLADETKKGVDTLLRNNRRTVDGYPALFLQAYIKKYDGIYNTLHVIRGNRVYTLIVGFPKGSDTADAQSYFNSFRLLPYALAAPALQQVDGFSTVAPAPFRKQPLDSNEKKTFYKTNYISTNAVSKASYQVSAEQISPTYWTSDSVFLHGKVQQYRGENDSLLYTTRVVNGGVGGLQAVVKVGGHNGLRKLRLLVSADTLYTLYSMVPAQDTATLDNRLFFEDFRLVQEAAPSIYTPKAARLLTTLQNGDSVAFDDAIENLSLVKFTAHDLPLLHEALLHPYRDSGEYRTVNDRLAGVVGSLADSTTVAFVEKHYAPTARRNPSAQYSLLTVLAQAKTAESYAVLKRLLLTNPPAGGNANGLRSALFDSLRLTATLYPALLQKATDSLLGYSVVQLANRLVDSAMLTQADLTPHTQTIVQGASAVAKTIQGDDGWQFVGWTALLAHLNAPEGNALLQRTLTIKNVYLLQAIIVALLKNNQPVPAAAIVRVAADKAQRGSFFDDLVSIKKAAMFPAVYATQRSLAESDLHSYFSDEYDEFTLAYVGERTKIYQGKRQVFHLFKVRLQYDEDGNFKNYLAVAGPYSTKGGEKIVYSDARGFYANEPYQATTVDKLLKAYLAELESAE